MGRLFVVLSVMAGLGSHSTADDILQFVPKQADLAIVVEHPKQALDAIGSFGPLRQLLAFPAVKEQLESTNVKRFRQLVAHFEKELGHPWPVLIEKLAGGGACLAVRIEGDPNPSLVVIKATDESMLNKAVPLILKFIQAELERSDSPIKVNAKEHRGVTIHEIGPNYLAHVGLMLFLTNRNDTLKATLDLVRDGPAESLAKTDLPAAARKLLPGQPAAWLVANLARLQEKPEAKEAYGYPKADPGQVIVLQGITDVVGRSKFLTAGLYAAADGYKMAVRMPAGQNATPDGLATHFPPHGQSGSLPLLEPQNVILSASFFLDLGKLWTERDRLFEESFRKQMEDGDKKLGRFLGGRKLADVLTSIGVHHRVVVVQQTRPEYNKKPAQLQPAAAFVSDLKNPGYAEAMNAILRTTALVLGTPVRLRFSDVKIGGVNLVTYRFPEDGSFAGDNENNRFNISPCFAKVGNQFVIASTVELGRELVELLQRPEVNDPAKGSPQSTRMRVYSSGGIELLRSLEDQLVTQTILERAISAAEATKEVAALVHWLKSLGQVEVSTEYAPAEFRLDLRLTNEPRRP